MVPTTITLTDLTVVNYHIPSSLCSTILEPAFFTQIPTPSPNVIHSEKQTRRQLVALSSKNPKKQYNSMTYGNNLTM